MANIQSELQQLTIGNEEYAIFHKKIANTQKTVLGVRMLDLRKLAKKIVKTEDSFTSLDSWLDAIDSEIYEQVLLTGLMISYAKIADQEKISLTRKYLQLVDSWAEIDSFVAKRPLVNIQLWWDFIDESLASEKEFVVRYGVIELMSNFLTKESINLVLSKLRLVKHNGYYVKTAMAWLYATAAVKFFELIIDEIESNRIAPWTKLKALQKMRESYQISPKQKRTVASLRLKIKKYPSLTGSYGADKRT